MKPVPLERLRAIGAVAFGALFLSWPLFYNGFPVLYPDSIDYLASGSRKLSPPATRSQRPLPVASR